MDNLAQEIQKAATANLPHPPAHSEIAKLAYFLWQYTEEKNSALSNWYNAVAEVRAYFFYHNVDVTF